MFAGLPHKGTLAGQLVMSQKGHVWTHAPQQIAALFDDFVDEGRMFDPSGMALSIQYFLLAIIACDGDAARCR